MKLVELFINSFGILSDFHLVLDKPLTVVYGPNEAGKSTLMAFIRAVLFGFKSEPRYLSLPVKGGHLILEGTEGVYRIERVVQGRSVDGRVKVVLPDGAAGNENFLKDKILRGTSGFIFRNIFAFDIDELRKVEEFRQDQISAYIYGAGTGVRASTLLNAKKAISNVMDDLLKSRGSNAQINKILKELKDCEKQIRQLKLKCEEYSLLRDRLCELHREQDSLSREKEEVLKRIRWLEDLIKARESWMKLEQARTLLKEIPEISIFPAYGVERIKDLEKQLLLLKVRRQDIIETIKQLDKQLKEIVINKNLLDNKASVFALEGEKMLYLEKLQSIPGLKSEVSFYEQALAEQLEILGPGWTLEKVIKVDTSLITRRRVESFLKMFSEQESKVSEAGADLKNKKENLQIRKKELEHIPQATTVEPLEKKEEALFSLEADYNRLEDITKELKHLEGRKEDLKSKSSGLPAWLPFLLLLFTLPGIYALFYDMFLGAVLSLFSLIITAVVYFVLRLKIKKELKEALNDVKKEITRLKEEEQELKKRIASFSQIVLGKEEVTRVDITFARKALTGEREALKVWEKTKEALLVCEEALKQAEKVYLKEKDLLDELKDEWTGWLKEHGLEVDLKPVDVMELIGIAGKMRDTARARDKVAGELGQAIEQVNIMVKRVNELALNIGLKSVNQEDLAQRLEEMYSAVEIAGQQLNEKNRIEKEIEQCRNAQRGVESEIEALQNEVQALLVAGGAKDKEDFCQREVWYRKRQEILQEIRQYDGELNILAGSLKRRKLLEEELEKSDRLSNEEELSRFQEKIKVLEKRHRDVIEETGRLTEYLSNLEKGEELARLRQEKEIKMEMLKGKIKKWEVYALSGCLIELAKEKHERERQPAVLLQASHYIEPMTVGVYKKIIAPVEGGGKLEAERPNGVRVEAAKLSRGAAAQLYLSMRFALARHYGKEVIHLPILLDDTLIDFDPYRLRGALKVIKEVSQYHQVILFTCHQHILDALREVLPDFGEIRLSG